MCFLDSRLCCIRPLRVLAFSQNKWRTQEFISGSHFLLKKHNHSKRLQFLLVDYPVTGSQFPRKKKHWLVFLGLNYYHQFFNAGKSSLASPELRQIIQTWKWNGRRLCPNPFVIWSHALSLVLSCRHWWLELTSANQDVPGGNRFCALRSLPSLPEGCCICRSNMFWCVGLSHMTTKS